MPSIDAAVPGAYRGNAAPNIGEWNWGNPRCESVLTRAGSGARMNSSATASARLPARNAGWMKPILSSPNSNVTERELLEGALDGDEDAFRHLIEPHRAVLFAHCNRMLGSFEDADDALQDTLLHAWRGLSGFDGRCPIRGWLYRIATNACLDLIERRPKRVLSIEQSPPYGAWQA